MRSLKKRGPHVLDDLMTSYFPYILKKFGQSLDTPTVPFLQNFSWAIVRMGPVNVPAKFEVRSFTYSSDNWVSQNFLGVYGVGNGTIQKSVGSSYHIE